MRHFVEYEQRDLPRHRQPRSTRRWQSGSLEDVYRYLWIDADSIVYAALDIK